LGFSPLVRLISNLPLVGIVTGQKQAIFCNDVPNYDLKTVQLKFFVEGLCQFEADYYEIFNKLNPLNLLLGVQYGR
jgi:hypothetical protein